MFTSVIEGGQAGHVVEADVIGRGWSYTSLWLAKYVAGDIAAGA